MTNLNFKQKLARGELLVGSIITLPSPDIAEIFCEAGFDWLFIDLEHSVMGVKEAQVLLQAASPQTACLVRVPSIDEVWIKKALDIGSAGLIIPQVKTAEQVARVVQLCKFPPQGVRSVGIARAHGYGQKFHEYVAAANEQTVIVIQIEHIQAVENIDAILSVPGIDCLFVGPYDLSASMGKTGLTTDPEVQNAIEQVKQAAQQAHVPLGFFGTTTSAVQPYIQDGYRLIAVGMDASLLGNAAREITHLLKG
jgi:2-dehydro-3-deoxyglucarate aldolase/4-hydroxy-2-oxoheptanedioate aldolase